MGRPESPLDPSSGPLAAFAWELRQLRVAAGTPTYRQLSAKAGYSSSALSAAAGGKQFPSLEVTLAFVGSCGADSRGWEERWRSVAAELPVPVPGPGPESSIDRGPARHPARRGYPAVIAAGTLAVTVTVAVGLLALHPWASAGQHKDQLGVPAFSATAGPYCPPSAVVTNPFHDRYGDGWHRARSQGVRGAEPCSKYLLYSQLARDPGDPGEWQDDYDWTFSTGLASPHCRVSFYIPVSARSNSTIYYWISAGSDNSSDRIASFTIDQAGHQGQWVTRGPLAFPGGTLFIELTDRGEGPPSADAVAAPVRVAC